jgi:hypothetical protein
VNRCGTSLAFGLAALLASFAAAGRAWAQGSEGIPDAAQQLPRRKASFATYGDWVAMTVGWRDVVDGRIRRQLVSGLPTVIAMRAYVFPSAGSEPISLSVKTCRVVFDLWDEVFRIDLRQGGLRRDTVAVNVEGVLRRCGEAAGMPVVLLKDVKASDRYFVGVLVEVNPVSKETLERIKRWVALPKGVGAVGPGDSLFGSFVGLFVTHVPAADRTLSFRTPSFSRGELRRLETK